MANCDVRKFVNGRLVIADDQVFRKQAPVLDGLVVSNPFLVISVGNCPQCEELAALLSSRGVPQTVFVKWDKTAAEYPALKASLAKHAGEVFTFPQVFAEGAYQGGFKEVMDKLQGGAYDDLFERLFDLEPCTLRRQIEKQAMIVYSLPSCPQCDVLYEDLRARGVPAQSLFVKLDRAQPEYASFKAQLQKLIGRDQFSFPQTFVRGVYQGNYDEVIAKADRGDFVDLFAEQFGIAPKAKTEETARPPAAAIAFDEDF